MEQKFKADTNMLSYVLKQRSLSMVVLDRSIHLGKYALYVHCFNSQGTEARAMSKSPGYTKCS
jgi:hypothetical protein